MTAQHRVWIALVAGAILLLAGCIGEESATLDDLQLVGIDFELNSIILTNNGADDVQTQGLWMYQDGQSSQFNVFTIEPRATILFNVRELGELSQSGGEIALYREDEFSNPEAIIDYVAWGRTGHSRADIATEAGLWGRDEAVETDANTVILSRTEPAGIGAIAWTAQTEIGG